MKFNDIFLQPFIKFLCFCLFYIFIYIVYMVLSCSMCFSGPFDLFWSNCCQNPLKQCQKIEKKNFYIKLGSKMALKITLSSADRHETEKNNNRGSKAILLEGPRNEIPE